MTFTDMIFVVSLQSAMDFCRLLFTVYSIGLRRPEEVDIFAGEGNTTVESIKWIVGMGQVILPSLQLQSGETLYEHYQWRLGAQLTHFYYFCTTFWALVKAFWWKDLDALRLAFLEEDIAHNLMHQPPNNVPYVFLIFLLCNRKCRK